MTSFFAYKCINNFALKSFMTIC